MRIKKWIAAVLLLCMVLTVLPVRAGAVSVVDSGSWGGPTAYWKLTSDGTLTISGSSRMEGLSEGEYPWVRHADKITHVVIESGITSISQYAFSELRKLISVKMGNTVTKIENYAFFGCTNLKEVVFSDKLTIIGGGAFYGCSSLKAVTIPADVQEIVGTAFFECTSLASVKFAANSKLKTIGENAFAYTAVSSLLIPSSVTQIGKYAFAYCNELVELKLSEGLKTIGDFAFHQCPKLTGNLYLPSTLERLGQNAFSNSYLWTSIDIRSPASYDEYFFTNNANLKKVTFGGKTTNICDDAFKNCTALERVTINTPVSRIGFEAFRNCTALSEVVFPESLKELWAYAFSSTGIQEVDLPDSLEFIGYGVFQDCAQLVRVKCGDGVTRIDNFAFENCTGLQQLDLGEVQSINESAFRNCDALKVVVFPSTVEYLGRKAFADCGSLTTIYFTGDAPTFGDTDVFSGINATVYYPAGNSTWTDTVMKDYGGTLTWVAHDPSVLRLAGANRWNTALKVADEMKANLEVEKFDAIIVASGSNFADALAGSYLSTVKNAPILLSWGQGGKYEYLDTDNIDYIKNNLKDGGTVYILGGVSAVPQIYETGLEGYDVVRLGGANRFETNILILEEAGIASGSEILVCTATNFADSLSASATGKPILLVWNERGVLYGQQPEFLASLEDCSFTVIGGENAVGTALAETISTYGDVERLAGENRFETSVLVAQKYFEAPEYAVLAYAWNYPDGLCGGALAYTLDAPLVLTMTNYETQAADYIQSCGIEKAIVLGGGSLISDDAIRTVFAMEAEAPVAVK